MDSPTGTLAAAVVRFSLLAAFLAACSSPPPPKPKPPSPPEPRSCGAEVVRRGEGYDGGARACIWNAYKTREHARFTTTRYTIEGDPISYTITITPTGFEVVVDSKDRLGQRGVFKHTCRTFERIVQEENAERFGFALSGCTGAGADRLAVP